MAVTAGNAMTDYYPLIARAVAGLENRFEHGEGGWAVGPRVDLAWAEVRVAGVQQPAVSGVDGDSGVAAGVAGQRD